MENKKLIILVISVIVLGAVFYFYYQNKTSLSDANIKEIETIIRKVFTGNKRSIKIIDKDHIETPEGSVYGTYNLYKTLANTNKEDWEDAINKHFSSLFANEKEDADFTAQAKNFDFASKYLSLQLYEESYFDNIPFKNDVFMHEDIEGLRTTVVFDMPTSLRIVTKDYLSNWNKKEDDIFSMLLKSIPSKISFPKPEMMELGKEKIYTIETRDINGGILIYRLNEHKELIGKFGSVVALPTRNLIIVMPVDDPQFVQQLPQLSFLTSKMYDNNPGSLTKNLYWYSGTEISKIKLEINDIDKKVNLTLPEKLTELLK